MSSGSSGSRDPSLHPRRDELPIACQAKECHNLSEDEQEVVRGREAVWVQRRRGVDVERDDDPEHDEPLSRALSFRRADRCVLAGLVVCRIQRENKRVYGGQSIVERDLSDAMERGEKNREVQQGAQREHDRERGVERLPR